MVESNQYGQYVVPTSDVCINLGVGQPKNDRLPLDEFNDALRSVASGKDPSILQYQKIAGYDNFRRDFANFLSDKYTKNYQSVAEKHGVEEISLDVNFNDLIMTNGITGALHLLFTIYANTNTVIFVEDSTYFIALDFFKELKLNIGITIKPVKIDKHGLDFNDLEQKISLEDKNKLCLLYIIPIYQNPTGYTMSEGRRMCLASLATQYPNLLVFADEVYHFLGFGDNTSPVFPMCYYHQNFISLGSFSKIYGPGIRLGWIHCRNKTIIDKISSCAILNSCGNLNPLGCAIAHNLVKTGKLNVVIDRWNNVK